MALGATADTEEVVGNVNYLLAIQRTFVKGLLSQVVLCPYRSPCLFILIHFHTDMFLIVLLLCKQDKAQTLIHSVVHSNTY